MCNLEMYVMYALEINSNKNDFLDTSSYKIDVRMKI